MPVADRDRRARRAFVIVGVVVPGVLLLASGVIIAVWWPQLPDPAAIHWSGLHPDGFAPRFVLLLTPLLGLAVVALLMALAALAARFPSNTSLNAAIAARLDDRPAPAADPAQVAFGQRFMASIAVATGALIAVVSVGSAAVQRGVDHAAHAGDITPWVLAGFVVAVLLGAAGWFVQPRAPRRPPVGDGV